MQLQASAPAQELVKATRQEEQGNIQRQAKQCKGNLISGRIVGHAALCSKPQRGGAGSPAAARGNAAARSGEGSPRRHVNQRRASRQVHTPTHDAAGHAARHGGRPGCQASGCCRCCCEGQGGRKRRGRGRSRRQGGRGGSRSSDKGGVCKQNRRCRLFTDCRWC